MYKYSELPVTRLNQGVDALTSLGFIFAVENGLLLGSLVRQPRILRGLPVCLLFTVLVRVWLNNPILPITRASQLGGGERLSAGSAIARWIQFENDVSWAATGAIVNETHQTNHWAD